MGARGTSSLSSTGTDTWLWGGTCLVIRVLLRCKPLSLDRRVGTVLRTVHRFFSAAGQQLGGKNQRKAAYQ